MPQIDLAVAPLAHPAPLAGPFASQAAPPRADPTAAPKPSPSLRLDPSLGVVVLEFHDHAGGVADTIPTKRQLEAYRVWHEGPRTGPAGQATRLR